MTYHSTVPVVGSFHCLHLEPVKVSGRKWKKKNRKKIQTKHRQNAGRKSSREKELRFYLATVSHEVAFDTHTHTHTHTRTHARTHAHTHTHTSVCCLKKALKMYLYCLIKTNSSSNCNYTNSLVPPHSHMCSLLNSRGQNWWRWVWRGRCLAHWWRKHNPIRLCSRWGSWGNVWRPSVMSALRHMLRSDDTQN